MSTLQIELDAQTEKRLRQISEQEGREVGEIAARLLSGAVRSVRLRPMKEAAEAELLRKINEGWSLERWGRYHELAAKRRTETLTAEEHEELIALTNEREIAHSHRLECLIELAKLRQTSLEAVMEELGIRAPGYV